MIKLFDWDVAKLVRHLTLNQAIAGSNPAIPLKKQSEIQFSDCFFISFLSLHNKIIIIQ